MMQPWYAWHGNQFLESMYKKLITCYSGMHEGGRELEDALEVLEREYDGYFCSIKRCGYYRDFGKPKVIW